MDWRGETDYRLERKDRLYIDWRGETDYRLERGDRL